MQVHKYVLNTKKKLQYKWKAHRFFIINYIDK